MKSTTQNPVKAAANIGPRRGIIMSGDNPKLILEGRKTQTRRIMASKYFDLETASNG